jgi:hypothetical protein
MGSEYVKCTRPEVIYGEKNLLHAEIDILQLTKHLKEYQKWRREEFIHKIVLKNKIDEVKDTLDALDKILPKTRVIKVKSEDESVPFMSKARALTLEQEIDMIRRRLDRIR